MEDIKRNELPEHIKSIDGISVRHYRPILVDELKECEVAKVELSKVILNGVLKSCHRPEVKDMLDGWGSDVVSASMAKIWVKGLELMEEGRYSDGIKLLEFSGGSFLSKGEVKSNTGVANLVNVNIASESFREKVEGLKGMMGSGFVRTEEVDIEVKGTI